MARAPVLLALSGAARLCGLCDLYDLYDLYDLCALCGLYGLYALCGVDSVVCGAALHVLGVVERISGCL